MNYEKAIDEIIRDISDRRGLGNEWEHIDPDIQQEIKETWIEILERQEGCRRLADWQIEYGDSPDDYTHSCTKHLPFMIADVEYQTLQRITGEPWMCCYVSDE